MSYRFPLINMPCQVNHTEQRKGVSVALPLRNHAGNQEAGKSWQVNGAEPEVHADDSGRPRKALKTTSIY